MQTCSGTDKLASLLIRCGADVHATCNHGSTPLVYAFESLQINSGRPGNDTNIPFASLVGLTFYLLAASVAATSADRDPEARFAAIQARLLSQERNFMARHGHGLTRFCEITEDLLIVFEYAPFLLNFHFMTKVLTTFGLDRKAVGLFAEHIYAEMGGEGSEGGPKLAEVLFPIQDRICEGLRNWKP